MKEYEKYERYAQPEQELLVAFHENLPGASLGGIQFGHLLALPSESSHGNKLQYRHGEKGENKTRDQKKS